MIIRLQHQRTDGDVDTYHLKSGRRYHIGRGSACEVRILDLKLSRKHCAVEYSEGEWRVIDLASTNGCKVDGDQIVGSVALTVGTQIEIGQTTLKVSRILGDDESDEDDESSAGAPPAAKLATPKPGAPPIGELRTPPPEQPTPLPAKANGSSHDSGRQSRPLEQVQLPEEERSGPVEHIADDWQPEPAPDTATQTGALVPNAAADAAADQALEAAKKAAMKVADEGGEGTGEIRKPAVLKTPAPGKPSSQELPAVKPEGSSSQYRKTPVPRQPTPLPVVAAEIESGPFKTLDPQPPARAAAMRSEVKPPTAKPDLELGIPEPTASTPEPAKQPGTETRKRQKIQPVIIQAMASDDAATIPAAAPPPASAPPMSKAAPIASAPPPAAAAPISPAPAKADDAKPGAGGDERTFYITVLGRRVGPLMRAVARDLKARELKGTLTLKDLDQYG